jgi:hypothetical protein
MSHGDKEEEEGTKSRHWVRKQHYNPLLLSSLEPLVLLLLDFDEDGGVGVLDGG